jgi:hypothetical protein
MDHAFTILASVVLGVSLAASCGLRAFLPLFVVGLLGRFGFVDVGDGFEWLTRLPALLSLGVGVVLELAGDKVPLVNHLLDLVQTPVRIAAGMLISAAVIVDLPMWVVALLAIIVGGGAALAVHTAKSALRAGGSAATGGAATPVLSLAEDVVALLATVLSVFMGLVSLAIATVAIVLLVVMARAALTADEAR